MADEVKETPRQVELREQLAAQNTQVRELAKASPRQTGFASAGRTDTPQPGDVHNRVIPGTQPRLAPTAQPRNSATGQFTPIPDPVRVDQSTGESTTRMGDVRAVSQTSRAMRAAIDPTSQKVVETWWKSMTEKERDERREEYEKSLVRLREGHVIREGKWLAPVGGTQGDIAAVLDDIEANKTVLQAAKATGNIPTFWDNNADAEGLMPAERIPAEWLHGYALPRGVTHISREYCDNMGKARAAGLSQGVVNAMVERIMKERGEA